MLIRQVRGRIVLLLLLVLLVRLAPAAPASAGNLAWSAEEMPGATGVLLGPSGVDVRDLAVASDGMTVYAVPGDSVPQSIIYESADSGASWSVLDVDLTADRVAVAPDDVNIVALASGTAAVALSTDGGLNWDSLGVPRQSGGGAAVAVHDIAVSPVAGDGSRYLAVAGEEAGGVANVWYYRVGATVPAWQETNSLGGFGGAHLVKAVAFSPGFASDMVMLAVTEKDGAYVNLEMLSLAAGQWNASAGFGGYPAAIVSDDGISGLASASMYLSPSYAGDDDSRRIVFVGLTVAGDSGAEAASGIYRLEDTGGSGLKTGVAIHSVAFNGSRLVAGSRDSNIVYRSADPLQASPAFRASPSLSSPGGEGSIVVAWAGGSVVAGSSGNESAFAVSDNGGETFNDIGLIDTVITRAGDVAVLADAGRVYLVTDDGKDVSLWLRTSGWQRVLGVRGAAGSGYLVRTDPGNPISAYVAAKGSPAVYYSEDAGSAAWVERACAVSIRDLAVVGEGVVYALDEAGAVTGSVNAGATWTVPQATGLDSGATLVSVGAANLLVGSRDGYVAYSADGGATWTEIEEIIEEDAGNVQVAADENFAANRTIYAASDTNGQNIWKWRIGSSSSWEDIFWSQLKGGIYGLAVEDGELYALEFRPSSGQSLLWQCLSPDADDITSSNWESWATSGTTDADDAAVHLNAAPRALKTSSDKLWAVKRNGSNKLYSLTIVMEDLELVSPAAGFTGSVNPVSGEANEVVFVWEGPDTATGYQLDIAYDSNFNAMVTTVTVESEEESVSQRVGPGLEGDARVNFALGTRYYWRVRVTQPDSNLYSRTRSFSIASLTMEVPALLWPANGSDDVSVMPSFSWEPVAGATEYRFVLSESVSLGSPLVSTRVPIHGYALTTELEHGRTYFWAVKQSAPVEGSWSPIAIFTVEEAPKPPVVIEELPPAEITLEWPEQTEGGVVILTPTKAAETEPAAFPYAVVFGLIVAVLMVAGVALIFRGRSAGTTSGSADRTEEAAGQHREPVDSGTPQVDAARVKKKKEDKSASAAELLLWMMGQTEEEAGSGALAAGGEESREQSIVSRIRAMAADLLYLKYPREAASLLSLWAHYGSREETGRYLTGSFRSADSNVIAFLRCYLTPAETGEPGASGKGVFVRAQYDEVAKVVEPENVLAAIRRLYGPALEKEEAGESGSPDRALAYQFVRLHRMARGGK